jgi:hypothetical protein
LPIQGTAAEIAIEALVRIDARLRAELSGRAQLLPQVHDEFVAEVEDEETVISAVKRVLEQEMIAVFEALLPGAPTRELVTAQWVNVGRGQALIVREWSPFCLFVTRYLNNHRTLILKLCLINIGKRP